MTTYADIGRILTLAELQMLKAHGIAGINPYLDDLNEKGCTEQYLDDIAAAGLRVGGFFVETTGGSGDPGYFTFPQGAQLASMAERILARFRAAGKIPAQVITWYCEDEHLDPPSLFDPFANGVQSMVTDIQAPGVYGWEDLIEWAREPADGWPHRYRFMGNHLAQTYGRKTGQLDVWQDLQETVEGVTIDVDDESVPGFVPGGGADMNETDFTRIQTMIDGAKAEVLSKLDSGFNLSLPTFMRRIFYRKDPLAGTFPVQSPDASTEPERPDGLPADARYFGASADFSAVGYTYADGTTHYFKDGKEVTS